MMSFCLGCHGPVLKGPGAFCSEECASSHAAIQRQRDARTHPVANQPVVRYAPEAALVARVEALEGRVEALEAAVAELILRAAPAGHAFVLPGAGP